MLLQHACCGWAGAGVGTVCTGGGTGGIVGQSVHCTGAGLVVGGTVTVQLCAQVIIFTISVVGVTLGSGLGLHLLVTTMSSSSLSLSLLVKAAKGLLFHVCH